MVRIAPSILSADFLNLENDIKMMESAGIDLFHMDVMDGMFVPNISYGPMILEHIKKISNVGMDAHLMIMEPNRYFDIYQKIGVEYLTIHSEASTHLERDLSQIRKLGMKSGVALNPATSEETIKYVLEVADMVLVMSVNPGFGGQKFIASQLKKIEMIKSMIVNAGLETKIEVDGGIGVSNLKDVVDAGADIVVSGSSLLKGDFNKNYQDFKDILNGK